MRGCNWRSYFLVMLMIGSSLIQGQSLLTEKKVSLKMENQPLRRALEEINQACHVHFIFDDKLIEGRTLTCNIVNQSLSHTIEQILPESEISFRVIQEDRIALFRTLQMTRTGRIHGRVLDGQTGQPIYYANVFLSNTTLGCATDQDGAFLIEAVPLGNYELVVTMMGYESHSTIIECLDSTHEVSIIHLKPSPVQGEQIVVTAPVPRIWRRQLREFQAQLLGTTANAKKCEILNPEILNFTYNKKTKMLTASAEEPLQIENRALGYHIEFYLMRFMYHENVEFKYYGKARFIPLDPENRREAVKWEEKRLETFRGSELHFFKAAFNGRLVEEGFDVRYVNYLPTDGAVSDAKKFRSSRSIVDCESPFQKRFSFPHYIQVEFIAGRMVEKVSYISLYAQSDKVPVTKLVYPVSWMKLNTESVIVNNLGIVETALGVKTFGEWATKRIADKLPNDYTPEKGQH